MPEAVLNKHMNDSYTIVLTPEQKEIVVDAIERFSQLWLGQTSDKFFTARQLAAKLKNIRPEGTNDLTK